MEGSRRRAQPRRRAILVRATPAISRNESRTAGGASSSARSGRRIARPPFRPMSIIPAFRAIGFDELARRLCRSLPRARSRAAPTFILIETIFDTLNAKAAYAGIETASLPRSAVKLPVMISGTITDLSGRTLSGQTPTAFWYVDAAMCKPFSVGLNCALGAREMRAHLAEISRVADTLDLRLSECRPAQRIRALRREPGLHGRISSKRVRTTAASSISSAAAAAPRQRSHPRNRQALSRTSRRAKSRRSRRNAALVGPRTVRARPRDDPLRQRRRAHQRHGLGALPQAGEGGRSMPPPSTSRATRSRTARRSSTSTWTKACSIARQAMVEYPASRLPPSPTSRACRSWSIPRNSRSSRPA